jgi:hypothetical protein
MAAHAASGASSTHDIAPVSTLPRPRTRALAEAELRGLGGIVLEQALLDSTAHALPSLVEWAGHLADELGGRLVPVSSNADLFRAIVAVGHATGAARPAAA